MTRQQALEIVWRRLFVIFVLLLAVIAAITFFAGDMRVSLLLFFIGNIGGYVTIHKSLANLKDGELIELSASWLGIVVPSFVGGILALVLYLLFLSNILSGEIFPQFAADDNVPKGVESIFAQHATGMSEYAKLFFWSFVAGFNQKYVVDVIDSVRSRT